VGHLSFTGGALPERVRRALPLRVRRATAAESVKALQQEDGRIATRDRLRDGIHLATHVCHHRPDL